MIYNGYVLILQQPFLYSARYFRFSGTLYGRLLLFFTFLHSLFDILLLSWPEFVGLIRLMPPYLWYNHQIF